MAYPLYTSLCGSENLSQIAVLDIAGLLFGFSIYMGLLGQTENGEKFNIKNLLFSALKTPAFVASVLGIIAGLSGVISRLIEGPLGRNLSECGKHFDGVCFFHYSSDCRIQYRTDSGTVKPCIKTIIMRVCLQTVMMAGVLLAVKYFVGSSRLLNLAVLMYMSSPLRSVFRRF